MSKNTENSPFLRIEESLQFCEKKLGIKVGLENIQALTKRFLLPLFKEASTELVLKDDLVSLFPAISNLSAAGDTHYLGRDLFRRGVLSKITVSSSTRIDLLAPENEVSPVFYAAVRNLISLKRSHYAGGRAIETSIPYFSSARVQISSPAERLFVEKQVTRSQAADISRVSKFARSAYYMGSKRNLAAFLVEAISSVLPENGVVVDLMCGSGAASGAFSRIWRTWASDAQEFCQLLALVQGAGFSVSQAQDLLTKLIHSAQKHAKILRKMIGVFLDREDKILHGDISERLLEGYRRFQKTLPTYPTEGRIRGWNPNIEVARRKRDPEKVPYCLFTAYFANVYFGLRQSVEIDSLRFAINHAQRERDRYWALGALIATLSALGTTYAAHFAQPRIRHPDNLKLEQLRQVLEQRAYSILHEFSVRLLNLAEESEKARYPVNVVPGPWQVALSILDRTLSNEKVLVYLDAPYKREEYSRYYHPLETLISYSYPSCVGRGKIPDKRLRERFQSEFFTKNRSCLTSAYAKVIVSVLQRGWMCAWSYSDSGAASVVEVVKVVSDTVSCRVKSYAAPYTHKSQGGRHPKQVTEYLVIFVPEEN